MPLVCSCFEREMYPTLPNCRTNIVVAIIYVRRSPALFPPIRNHIGGEAGRSRQRTWRWASFWQRLLRTGSAGSRYRRQPRSSYGFVDGLADAVVATFRRPVRVAVLKRAISEGHSDTLFDLSSLYSHSHPSRGVCTPGQVALMQPIATAFGFASVTWHIITVKARISTPVLARCILVVNQADIDYLPEGSF